MPGDDPPRDVGTQPEPPPLGAGTLGRFLIGDPDAMLALPRAKGALLLGLVLVLGTGLAREYDGEDLLHEPWHALIPLAASLVPSSLLSLLVWLGMRRRSRNATPLAAFAPQMLAAFWMTAPIRIAKINSDGTAIFQRRPDQCSACEGRNISTRGAKTMTPIASPTHQVNHPNGALLALSNSVVSWAATPIVGAMVLASRPPRARVSITARGVSRRRTGPTKR